MNMETEVGQKTRISFHFHPYHFDEQQHAVEKADESGNQRRYLRGVASGSKWDAHGERMTDACIKDFGEQAKRGDILLYPDIHGIQYTKDIGILTDFKVLPDGNWFTEFRLYDQHDPVDQASIETADKLWRQQNGLPPYKYKREKGFSIEGYVPDDGIIEVTKEGGRVIDKVELDGVIVTPRPAYQDSIASAVYKALGEQPPWERDNTLQGRLKNQLAEEELRDSYFRKRYQIDDALNDLIRECMSYPYEQGERRARLEEIFDEYKSIMIDLLMRSESLFQEEDEYSESATGMAAKDSGKVSVGQKYKLLKDYYAMLESIEKYLEKGDQNGP
jgi:hypothetical protein